MNEESGQVLTRVSAGELRGVVCDQLQLIALQGDGFISSRLMSSEGLCSEHGVLVTPLDSWAVSCVWYGGAIGCMQVIFAVITMRYGGVDRVLEGGVKRRRLATVAAMSSSAAAAAAAAAARAAETSKSDDVGEESVFDLEILDCAICTEPLASPIYQCENGHIACASCSKLTNRVCPSCKEPTGSIRCLALEKLIESLKLKCKFALVGCPDMVKFSEKSHHERLCAFAPLSCPFPECTQFQGRYEALQEHVKENHPANWDALQHHTEVVFSMRALDRFHLLFDSALYFVVHRRRSSVGDMCYLTLPKVLSARYGAVHYRMEIRATDGATFKVDAQCSMEDSKGTPRDGFVVVPDDRSVEISVLFLPPRPPPRLLGTARCRAQGETVTLL